MRAGPSGWLAVIRLRLDEARAAAPMPCRTRAAISSPGIPGQAAGQAGGGKDHQAGLEYALAAEEVARPGREEQEPAEGDQVGIDHPLLIGRREPESGLHGRQGHVHDRRVDDDHEVGHARDGQDHARRKVRPGGRLGRGRRRSGGSGVGHDSDSFGKISSVPNLLNKFKLNKFK